MNTPPKLDLQDIELSDPIALHERLVDLFGAYFLWCHDEAIKKVGELLIEPARRELMATANRQLFESAASALRVGCEAKDLGNLQAVMLKEFAQNLLLLLSGTGTSLPVSSKLAARFKLVLELCDKDNEEVVHEEVINRGGKKFFADYWNRWINRPK